MFFLLKSKIIYIIGSTYEIPTKVTGYRTQEGQRRANEEETGREGQHDVKKAQTTVNRRLGHCTTPAAPAAATAGEAAAQTRQQQGFKTRPVSSPIGILFNKKGSSRVSSQRFYSMLIKYFMYIYIVY